MQTLSPYTAVTVSGGPGFPRRADYLCDDPQRYMDEFAAVTPGAIPADHQPHFANPPNEAQQRALEVEDIVEEREAVLDRIDTLRRGN